jgi:FkbM family methyltransferase
MIARAFAVLTRLLRGRGGDAPPEDCQSLRRRLDEARRAVPTWKMRVAEARGQSQALRQRALTAERMLRELRREVVAARRETPSIAALKLAFQHRLRTLEARTRDGLSHEREAHLLNVSPAYRCAVEGTSDVFIGKAERGNLEGLTWWVPRGARDTRVPFRGILQTREATVNGVMLDLGAKVGRMSVPRVILGDVTRAYCAEADPVTFACLARNIIDNRLRGLVLPDQTAIGDRTGTVRLLRAGRSDNFRVVPDNVEGDVVEVPCWTLDAWVKRLQVDLEAVTFIKVDVEGSERRVLAGAAEVLSHRHIAWQMEIKPLWLKAAGAEPAELYADLQRWFTHFIDLNRAATGRRERPVEELSGALAYIEPDKKTDLLLFSAPTSATDACGFCSS